MPFLGWQGCIRVAFFQRVVGNALVDEGNGHRLRVVFIRFHAKGGGTDTGPIGIAGDIHEQFFHRHVDLHLRFHGAVHLFQRFIHKGHHLGQVFQCSLHGYFTEFLFFLPRVMESQHGNVVKLRRVAHKVINIVPHRFQQIIGGSVWVPVQGGQPTDRAKQLVAAVGGLWHAVCVNK